MNLVLLSVHEDRRPGVILSRYSRIPAPGDLRTGSVHHILGYVDCSVIKLSFYHRIYQPVKEAETIAAFKVNGELAIAFQERPVGGVPFRFKQGGRLQALPLAATMVDGTDLIAPGHFVPCLEVVFLTLLPDTSVHQFVDRFSLHINADVILTDETPTIDIALPVVDRQVIEDRKILHLAYQDRVIALFQDRLGHTIEHTDTFLVRGDIPVSLTVFIRGVTPTGDGHQLLGLVILAARNLGIRIHHHIDIVIRRIGLYNTHPGGTIAAASGQEIIDRTVDDVVYSECVEVRIVTLAKKQTIGAFGEFFDTLDQARFGIWIVAFLGGKTVEDQLKDRQRITQFKAAGLDATVLIHDDTTAGNKRIDGLAHFQATQKADEEVGGVGLVLTQEC